MNQRMTRASFKGQTWNFPLYQVSQMKLLKSRWLHSPKCYNFDKKIVLIFHKTIVTLIFFFFYKNHYKLKTNKRMT